MDAKYAGVVPKFSGGVDLDARSGAEEALTLKLEGCPDVLVPAIEEFIFLRRRCR